MMTIIGMLTVGIRRFLHRIARTDAICQCAANEPRMNRDNLSICAEPTQWTALSWCSRQPERTGERTRKEDFKRVLQITMTKLASGFLRSKRLTREMVLTDVGTRFMLKLHQIKLGTRLGTLMRRNRMGLSTVHEHGRQTATTTGGSRIMIQC